MYLFYDFTNKEVNIFPSENFNKTIEVTKSFNAYATEDDFIIIDNMNDFYDKVEQNETKNEIKNEKKTVIYNFTDRLKNNYQVIKTDYGIYTLLEFTFDKQINKNLY